MPERQKPIKDEIAGVEKDIFRDYLGKIQTNPDKILKSESGGKGLELYEDLLRDAKVGSTLQSRRLAVTGKEWEVIPASEKRQDVKIADYVKQVLEGFSLDAFRKSALSGLVLGFKPCEVMWEYSEGDVWVSRIIPKDARRFVFDLDGRLRLLTLSNMVEGEEVPDRKFHVFTNPSDNGSPYGDGLGRLLYWPVWFKKNGIKFWLIFAEKFGSPTIIGRYPPGTQKDQQDELLDVLEAIQQESAIKIPETMAIELLEAQRRGATDTYNKLCDFMDRQIGIIMLGHTGSSESTPGKLGSEDMAKEVRDDIVKADADLLCLAENEQLVHWIVDYNFPGVARSKYPKVWIRTEEEQDLKPLAERDEILVSHIGLPVARQYFYDTYSIPEPKAGEETVAPAPKRALPFNDKGDEGDGAAADMREHRAGSKCSCGQHHDYAASDEWVKEYMARLRPTLQGLREEAVTKIEEWLSAQASPPTDAVFVAEVQAILGESFSKVDRAKVGEIVADIYTWHKLGGGAVPGIEAAFGGADLRAVDWLAGQDHFYLSKWLRNPEIERGVNEFLKERYLEGGEGLFGRGDLATVQKLKDMLSQEMINISEGQVNRIVDTAVQRTRNWAHVNSMHEAGIVEITVFEPTQDCPFCQAMHGRVIAVETAYGHMEDLSEMSPEEYEQYLKTNPPVALPDNVDLFLARGDVPPYHPFCRGRLIKKVK